MEIKRENDLIRGFQEEDYFANSIMIQYNYKNPFKPSTIQDKTEHWDIGTIGRLGNVILIDVKSKKNNTYEFHDIEFQNVSGNKGWLLGKADYIAFRISDEQYCVVRRIDLLKYGLKYIVSDTNNIDNYILDFEKYGYNYNLKKIVDVPNLTIYDRYKNKYKLCDFLYKRYKRSDFINKFTNKPNDDIMMLIRTSELFNLDHWLVNFINTPFIYDKGIYKYDN